MSDDVEEDGDPWDAHWREWLPAELGREVGSLPTIAAVVNITDGAPVVGQARQAVNGAQFILDTPAEVPTIWGDGEAILWARGEPFMLCGPSGVGKTTIAQQVVLALLGRHHEVLGLPVVPIEGKVAYLAMDRPAQAARSFKRMVGEADRELLAARLEVWKGPLPFDVRKEPETLLRHIRDRMGCSAVVIDSLKDLAAELDRDLSAGQVNKAVQMCVAADIEVCALHHQRKAQAGAGKPTALADVYGNTWITAGMGSVALIWGDPGDPVVELTHLKQPVADVGPLSIVHDHFAGASAVERGFDLLAFIGMKRSGASAQDIAAARFSRPDPTRPQVEKARRMAEAAVRKGLLATTARVHGDGGEQVPTLYVMVSNREAAEVVPTEDRGEF